MAKNDERPRGKKAKVTEDDALGLNGIERGRAQSAQPRPRAAPEASASAATKGLSPRAMPDEIRERFIGIGVKYYFPDGAPAFTDHGAKLTTRSENTEVIRSLVAIAQAREWGEIKVTGTERFRKEAWFAARIVGLEVQGYEPSEFEQERVVRAIARRAAAGAARQPPGSIAERPVPRDSEVLRSEESGPIVGRLVDHGRAPYRHDPKASSSYYVRIETERGDREVWGVDLERAFRESLSRPTLGDEVTVRAYGRDAVTVKTPEGEVPAHRNRWIVERGDFLAERAAAAQVFRDPDVNPAQAVEEHPELQGSYLQLQAAKLGAERDIRDPQDRERFVARARAAIAEAIERGEPLEPVRIRERRVKASKAEKARVPEETPTR
jgi:hypothetical protein